jgi:hypothetical protein
LSHAESVSIARKFETIGESSRTTYPESHGRADSSSSALIPQFPIDG